MNPRDNNLTYQLLRNAEANDDNPDAPANGDYMCIDRETYERVSTAYTGQNNQHSPACERFDLVDLLEWWKEGHEEDDEGNTLYEWQEATFEEFHRIFNGDYEQTGGGIYNGYVRIGGLDYIVTAEAIYVKPVIFSLMDEDKEPEAIIYATGLAHKKEGDVTL